MTSRSHDYRETLDPDSPEIVLLSPQRRSVLRGGRLGGGRRGAAEVPGPTTRWTADTRHPDHESPVTLTWDNGQGLVFKRTFAVDENYMFTMRQSVGEQRRRRRVAVCLTP